MKTTRIDLDYADASSGMLVGRWARIADWAFRKEQRETEALIQRMRVRKWALDNPERRRANARRFAAKPGVMTRYNEAKRRRREEAWRKLARVFICAECSIQWCRVPWGRKHGGPTPKFCSGACSQRNGYQRKTPKARRTKRRGGR